MFQPIQPANNRMHTATSERIMPFGKDSRRALGVTRIPIVAIRTTVTMPPACNHASFNARIRCSPITSVKPAKAASAPMMMPAPSSQRVTMAQFAFPVIQYATSQANVVLAHLAAGGRDVMMAHGVSKAFADRFMVGGAVVAGLVATLIMLGMCGMRVQFV